MKSPFAIPGLKLVSTRNAPGTEWVACCYQFAPVADRETVKCMIDEVTEQRELTFFDSKHPQLSDPGAYITVIRQKDELFAMRGNHGWSSPWVPVSENEIIDYLVTCIPDNGPVFGETVSTNESSNLGIRRDIDRSPKADFRQYLNERLSKA